ncbi:MAG: hypothetical protein ACJAV7_001518 [Flavobacteriales bacterium]|jgi:hypothetical protein
MIKWISIVLFSFALVAGCKIQNARGTSNKHVEFPPSSIEEQALFTEVSGERSGIGFINRALETESRNISDYDYFYNGGGVAIGDFNNDDLPDLFFAGNDVPNRMYFNRGDLQFEDVTEQSGISGNRWSTGATTVDINSDGWLDIYVCNSGPDADSLSTENELWINKKDGTFVDESIKWGVNDSALSTQGVFFDLDNDGDLDLWVLNHSERRLGNQAYEWLKAMKALPFEKQKLLSNTIYENQGDGSFKDITTRSGLRNPGFGLGIALSDFNSDGLLDVYVANDYFFPDLYYLNQGRGSFVEVSKEKLQHMSFFSMGCDAADINNDGLSDLLVLDMTSRDHVRSKTNMNSMSIPEFRFLKNDLGFLPQYMTNMLQLNRGGGEMSEIAHLAGVDRTDWSWAPLIADFDNDGWKDIYVTNGIMRDVKNNDWRVELLGMLPLADYDRSMYFQHLQQAPQTPMVNPIFRNRGDLTFDDVSEKWGMQIPSFSNGAAYGDLDLDGDLDLVVNNLESAASIWMNNSNEREEAAYLQIKLEGPSSHVSGAVVQVSAGDEVQTSENLFTRGYVSSVDPILHFGLGNASEVSLIKITWADGLTSELTNVFANQRLVIQSDELDRVASKESEGAGMFMDESTAVLGRYQYHHENVWDDFGKEILLPHEMSRMGPGLAIGDVNGDGQEDFFIGAGTTNSSSLFLQKDGVFTASETEFKPNRNAEIIDACFFDVDNDQDLDLIAASGGGGEFEGREKGLKDVLYLNDGRGNFSPSANYFASETSSGLVLPFDVDNDGWMDLFVGCRNVPGEYGKSGKSAFYKNEGGNLIDRTDEYLVSNADLGMVTDAIAEDLNDDGLIDLMIVGEWMNITVLMNRKTTFETVENPALRNMKGWWRSVHKADLDGDGDMDFIVGNIGENNKFHPSFEHPLHLFAGDFDENSTWDIVLSKEYNGTLVPVRGKECSTAQMPFVAHRFSTFDEFATSSVYDVLGENYSDSSIHRVAHTFSHVIIENLGAFNFKVHKMQRQAQMSPLNALGLGDWNEDGLMDLLIAGNESGTEVETVPYDAGKGLVLLNNGIFGGQEYEVILDIDELGVALSGDVKRLEWIVVSGQSKILVVENAGPIRVLSILADK